MSEPMKDTKTVEEEVEKRHAQLCRLLHWGEHPVLCSVLRGESVACDCKLVHEAIKSIFRNTMTSAKAAERERITEIIKSKRKEDPRDKTRKYNHLDVFGYNIAIDEIISSISQEDEK